MTPYPVKRIYSKRKAIVEPVFGWIKENRGIRKLSRRGIVQCQDKWSLICLTQNLRTVCSRGSVNILRELILQKKQGIKEKLAFVVSELYPLKIVLKRSTYPD